VGREVRLGATPVEQRILAAGEIGGVVAFISGIGRLNDPWGDLVNYFRDINVTQIKYRLLAEAVDQLL
jgi:hypothetical protein